MLNRLVLIHQSTVHYLQLGQNPSLLTDRHCQTIMALILRNKNALFMGTRNSFVVGVMLNRLVLIHQSRLIHRICMLLLCNFLFSVTC